MNWLANLWRALVSKTSTVDEVTEEVTQVEVEEDSRPVGEIFAHVCRESGVKLRALDNTNAVALFEEWYEGEKSRLESESKRLGIQKNLADKQAGSWYLGKHLTGG